MSAEKTRTGSRYLYEPFDSAHARIETHERVTEERWAALERRLGSIEVAIDRLERRIWVAVYSVAAALVAEMVYQFLTKIHP